MDPRKKQGLAILICNKLDFKLNSIKRDEGGHSILITGEIRQDELSILNIYAQKTKASTFIKETLLKLKSQIKPHTLIVGDFNTPVSPLDRPTRQKINKEAKEVIEVMIQLGLTDIYRTFHQNTKEYAFFSVSHRTFSKIAHILGNISNINSYKKIGITPCI